VSSGTGNDASVVGGMLQQRQQHFGGRSRFVVVDYH